MQAIAEPGDAESRCPAIDVVVPAHDEGASVGAILQEFHHEVAVESEAAVR
jgi:hypothetical protein